MKTRSKKHKGLVECTGEIERDRLSELPDDVLVKIPSFLPTLNAVRTMLLKRFGNLWTLVPNLEFDDDDWEYNDDGLQCSHFTKFIHNVLILHRRPTIDKFVLKVEWAYHDDALTKIGLEVWLRFVLSRAAKTLTLELPFEFDEPPTVPVSVFKSQSLVQLTLHNCCIEVPSRAHMGSLRTLLLDRVVVKEGDLNKFVSGCPFLQDIVLDNVEGKGVGNLSFSAPNVEKLEIIDLEPSQVWTINCPNLKFLEYFVYFCDVSDINVPSVSELSIGYFYYDEAREEHAHRLKWFLERFQSLEVLKLTEAAILQLTYNLVVNVGFPQNRWKRVVLKSSIQLNNIAGVCSLVRDSPCLEELIIHIERDRGLCLRVDVDVVSQEACFPCVAPRLKVVVMRGYVNPDDCQLRLIKFLLKSAANLDELVIFPNKRLFNQRKFVKKLSKFSRGSKKARIVFESEFNN